MAPKKKQEKMALGDFLTNQSLGSWADEMDNQPIPSVASGGYGSERRGFASGGAWGERSGSGYGDRDRGGAFGDRNASYDRPRFGDREQLPLPTKPPFTAHLGNLAFDVTSTDVESFLGDCQVTSVRIVEDKMDRKPKGFGYVEFATLDGLKKALELNGQQFQGRGIRISVAEPPKDRQDAREITDWTRKGPLPDLPGQGMGARRTSERGPPGGGFGRSFDNASDAGSDRGGDRRRPGFFENDGKVRDFNNWERKGPLSPAPGAGAPPMREGGRLRDGGAARERRQSPAWGEGQSEQGSRPPRREFVERPGADRAPTAADQDNQWRSKMRPDAPSPAATPDVSTPSSPAAAAPPASRQKLNLAKRTVSTAETGEAAPSGPPSASDNKASPFGAARPIDTATREKEIEEKRELAVRQKGEADAKQRDVDAKQRDDRTAKEAASRAARADRADKGQQKEDGVRSPVGEKAANGQQNNGDRPARSGAPKENGENAVEHTPKPKPSFSILQRDEDAADDEDEDAPDAPANGTIVADKDTKPQEVVREVGADSAAGAGDDSTTAEAMEQHGWSTVAAKPKPGRKGGARALAS